MRCRFHCKTMGCVACTCKSSKAFCHQVLRANNSVNRTQIPLRGLCAGYLKR